MADDKRNIGEPDRSRVAAGEDYEVRYVAERTGLTPGEVRDLIAEVGNDRDRLMEAAQQRKSRQA